MQKITIYHNNRCSKSRCALELLEKKKTPLQIIDYLRQPPTVSELKVILKKLKLPAESIVRKKEKLYQKEFSGKTFTETQWLKILTQNPILIERPIVIAGSKAVVGRPPENVLKLI